MQEFGARMTLDANGYISAMMKNIEYTNNFRKTVEDAKRSIEKIEQARAQTKIEVDAKKALEDISQTKKHLNEIKKNVAIVIAAKETATESINRIKGNVKSITSRPFNVIIKAKDEVSNIIRGITDKLFSLKTLAAGIIIGGAGKGAYDFTLGQGVKNENYLATLRTVLNDKKKGDEALAWSYTTALKTPFRADEVVEGVSNVVTAQLDYKKYLMPLANLSAVKNRPLKQSIEFASTLASGDMGEAVMRGRDLGINKKMWMSHGMEFDEKDHMTNTPEEALNATLEIIKDNHWDGLMDAKSKTAGGMMSNIADTGLSFGRALGGVGKDGQFVEGGPFEVFKKQLTTLQPLLDGLYQSQGFKKLTKDVSDLVAAGEVKGIDPLGFKLLGVFRSFAYWICIIMCIVEICKSLLQGDTKSLGKIIIKYILAFAAIYFVPWIFDIIKESF